MVNKALDNNMVVGYVLKADIKHFFDTVDHNVLMTIIKKKIKDQKILWLIKGILDNHITEEPNKGMPIGNLTSQFFANLYLNELDYFVKHELKIKHYIRYVDDFVLLDKSKQKLECVEVEINTFLKSIKLELHPEKSQIYPLQKGVKFLGFRIFYYYKLLNKKNVRKTEIKLEYYRKGLISLDEISRSLAGWFGYAIQANTHNMRNRIRKEIENYTKTKNTLLAKV